MLKINNMTDKIKDLQELIKQKDTIIKLLMETIDSQKQTINSLLSKFSVNEDLSNEEYIKELNKIKNNE